MPELIFDEYHTRHILTLSRDEIIRLRLAMVLIGQLLDTAHDCEALSLDGDHAADLIARLPEPTS